MCGGVWLSAGGFTGICDPCNRTKPRKLRQDWRKLMEASDNPNDLFVYMSEMLLGVPENQQGGL